MKWRKVTEHYYERECGRYAVSFTPGAANPYIAWRKPASTACDRDGFRPQPEILGGFDTKSGAIAACSVDIRKNRYVPQLSKSTAQHITGDAPCSTSTR